LKTRIASSLALAAAILVGASGCALFAPQSTLEQYAPSDGVEATVAGIDIRNALLVMTKDGTSVNVVFTAVNSGSSSKNLTMSFVSADGAAQASAEFEIAPGSTLFGDPEGEIAPTLVPLPGLVAGQTAKVYLQIPGSSDVELDIPVVDGTLVEYQDFVLPGAVAIEDPAADAAADEAGAAANEAEAPADGETPAEGEEAAE